jgi:hypothetical protein
MGRGVINDEVREVCKRAFGTELSLTQLRLLPYIQHTLINTREIDTRKINADEMVIMAEWSELGYLQLLGLQLTVTKKFWDAMNDVLWVAYADRRLF